MELVHVQVLVCVCVQRGCAGVCRSGGAEEPELELMPVLVHGDDLG